jgi:hypothetical protein
MKFETNFTAPALHGVDRPAPDNDEEFQSQDHDAEYTYHRLKPAAMSWRAALQQWRARIAAPPPVPPPVVRPARIAKQRAARLQRNITKQRAARLHREGWRAVCRALGIRDPEPDVKRKYGPRSDPPPPPSVWFRYFPSWETSPVVVPGIKALQTPDIFLSRGWPKVQVDCGRWKRVSHPSNTDGPTPASWRRLYHVDDDTDTVTPIHCDTATRYLEWERKRQGPAEPEMGAERTGGAEKAARKRERAWQKFWDGPLVFTSLKPKLSLSKLRPWEQEGVSRATWYRRRRR